MVSQPPGGERTTAPEQRKEDQEKYLRLKAVFPDVIIKCELLIEINNNMALLNQSILNFKSQIKGPQYRDDYLTGKIKARLVDLQNCRRHLKECEELLGETND